MKQVTVLYNDRCPICRAEIGHYRRLAERHGAPVRFAGLHAAPLAELGLERDQAMRRLHAVRGEHLLDGVDAFVALWRVLPGWRWLARVVGLPGVRHLAALVYDRALAPWLYARSKRRAPEPRHLVFDESVGRVEEQRSNCGTGTAHDA